MADELTTEPTPPDDDTAIEAEVAELTASPEAQQADKVKAALIAAKKSEKALKKKLAELEPIAANAQAVNERLTQVQPVISAILSNPKLRAEALRAAGGTRMSPETTDQPEHDTEATAVAEEFGFYLADGVTPDVARGQRVLDRMDRRSKATAENVVRPLAGVTLGTRAEANIREIIAMTDDDGVPYATPESIRETVAKLGDQAHLAANPQVVQELILPSAIGLDRIKRRTPKASDAPIFLERNGSSRLRPEPMFNAEEKRTLAALGLTDADIKRTSDKLEKAGGGAVALGS